MDVQKANDGSGFIFYLYRGKADIVFVIPGKDISFPNGFDGPKRVLIDDVLYEFMVVNESDFLKTNKHPPDRDVLNAHMAYEEKYILDSHASPLTKMAEKGIRVRPASGGQPEMSFNFWQAQDPKNAAGPSQSYLSTVSDGQVVYVSMIARAADESGKIRSAAERISESFQQIVNKQQCPKK